VRITAIYKHVLAASLVAIGIFFFLCLFVNIGLGVFLASIGTGLYLIMRRWMGGQTKKVPSGADSLTATSTDKVKSKD